MTEADSSAPRDASRSGLRIAIATWGLSGGPTASVAADVARGLLELGCSVDIVVSSAEPVSSKIELMPEIQVISLGRRARATALGLARYLRRARPDVLITLGWLLNGPGLLAKALARYRGVLLLSERGVLSYEARAEHGASPLLRLMPWFAGRFYRYADGVIALGEGIRSDLELLGVPASLISVVPNPIYADRIRRLAHESSDIQPRRAAYGDEPLFISVGRLERVKNHRYLLDAFLLVRRRLGKGKLLIVGDGSMRADLERAVVRLGLQSHVVLCGHVVNPLPLVAKADALVLTSRREGFPLVLVEAMAVGIPVVAVNCPGGVAQTVGDAGLLVPPNDLEALAVAMEQVASDDALRANLIKRGDAQMERLQPVVIARQWLNVADTARSRRLKK